MKPEPPVIRIRRPFSAPAARALTPSRSGSRMLARCAYESFRGFDLQRFGGREGLRGRPGLHTGATTARTSIADAVVISTTGRWARLRLPAIGRIAVMALPEPPRRGPAPALRR